MLNKPYTNQGYPIAITLKFRIFVIPKLKL